MSKFKLKREFRFSYAELNVIVNSKTNFAMRDLTEFAEYGYTTEKIQAIVNANQELAAIPTDREMEGVRMLLVEQKDVLVSQLAEQLRKFLLSIAVSNSRHTAFFKQFKPQALSQVKSEKLISEANRIVAMAEKYKAIFEPDGVTDAKINALQELRTQLAEVIVNIDVADSERVIFTDQRVTMANKLYASLATLCLIGKGIWVDRGRAKYQDYVLERSKLSSTVEDPPDNTSPTPEQVNESSS